MNMSRRKPSAIGAGSWSPIRPASRTFSAELERFGVTLAKDDPRLARLLDEVKDKEAQGYAYEGADASFELLARRSLGTVPDYFDVERFRVDVERRHNAKGELVTVSEAIVKMRIDSAMC